MFDITKHYKGNNLWLPSSLLMLTKAGSHAYGMATPTSDLDIRGVCVPPERYFIGYHSNFEQVEIKGDPDIVVYDIRKFFKLASECNPNIIEYVFSDPGDWVIDPRPEWLAIVEQRDLFLSKMAQARFSGYAYGQLHRIQTHRKWLLSPPTEEPTRASFGLSNAHRALNREQMGAYDALIADGHEFSENVMDLLRKERLYQSALTEWKQYQSWRVTRNETRSKLEAQFGYDTKHAAHLVRLLRMAYEIMTEGKVIVKRPDAEELLSIRRGAWTYDQLMSWAEDQERKCVEAAKSSTLPGRPDHEKLEKLCMVVVDSFLNA